MKCIQGTVDQVITRVVIPHIYSCYVYTSLSSDAIADTLPSNSMSPFSKLNHFAGVSQIVYMVSVVEVQSTPLNMTTETPRDLTAR